MHDSPSIQQKYLFKRKLRKMGNKTARATPPPPAAPPTEDVQKPLVEPWKIMRPYEFTTERLTEERVMKWNITNFTEFQETNKLESSHWNSGLRFCIGLSLGPPSIWKLRPTFSKAGQMGLYLYLEAPHKSGIVAQAKFSASIKNPKTEMIIVSKSKGITEFSKDKHRVGWYDFVTLDKLHSEGALDKDDTLTLHFKMVLYGDEKVTTPVRSQEILQQNSVNQIVTNYTKLLKTGESSDLIIRVKVGLDSEEYEERKVHRHILAFHSPVFEAMFGSPMLEKETGIVTIEDFTPKGLDIFLEYVYTGNLPEEWRMCPEEVVYAAEKYDFALLKDYMNNWLHTAATPENALILLNLAKKTGLAKAFNNIVEYIKTNVENMI